MRSSRARPAGALVLAAALGVALLASPAIALAASPTPTPALGDPRSPGQGPGLVGDPLTAIVVVAAIALVTVGITLAYVRLTARRGDPRDRPGG